MTLGHGGHGGGHGGGHWGGRRGGFFPYVDNTYRDEEVDLQPGGSTIVVTTPSDNPFEDARDIFVLTQQSGGMEGGPDPKMKSRKVYTAVANHKAHTRGRVPAIRHIASAHQPLRRGGFMPGMGDQSDDFAALTAAQDTQFLPAVQASPGAMVVTPASAAPTSTGPSFMSTFAQGLTAASKAAAPLLAQRTGTMAPRPPAPVTAPGTGLMQYLPYAAAGIGGLLLLKLLFGSSPRPVVLATNPRKRRR